LVTEHQRADAIFQFTGRRIYSDVKILGSNFISQDEIEEANKLLQQARIADGRAFPADIDQKFSEIASRRKTEQPLAIRIEILLTRCLFLLLNPRSSWGLPAELGAAERITIERSIANRDFSGLLSAMEPNAPALMLKLFSFAYRCLIFFGLGVCSAYVIYRHALGLSRKTPTSGSRTFQLGTTILMCSLVILASRLLFFSYLGYLESRYLVQAIPFVELGLVFFLFELYERRFESFGPERYAKHCLNKLG
jgi:hypothetical protein